MNETSNAVKPVYRWNVFGLGKFGAVGCFVEAVIAATKEEAYEIAVNLQLTPVPVVEIDMSSYLQAR